MEEIDPILEGKKNLKLKIAVAIIFATLFCFTFVKEIFEVFSNHDNHNWESALKLTLALAGGIFLVLIVLWRKDLLPTTRREFCSISHDFEIEYPDIVYTVRNEDVSDLWYIFINTRKFTHTKSEINNFFNYKTGHKTGRLVNNLQVWSLLGSSELLLKFRTHTQDGPDIFNSLKKILSKKGLLENPFQIGDGMVMIDCGAERVRNLFKDESMFPGNHYHKEAIKPGARYTKVFIKFQFEIGHRVSEISEKITSILNQPLYKPFVEVFSFTEALNPNQFAMIELIFPCGKAKILDDISKALEGYCRTDIFFKETYLGYDMELINRKNGKLNTISEN